MISSYSKLTAILMVSAFLFVGTSANLIAQGTGSGGTGGNGQTGGGGSSGEGLSLERPELTTDINEISERI